MDSRKRCVCLYNASCVVMHSTCLLNYAACIQTLARLHASTPRSHQPSTHAPTHALIHPRTHFPVDLQLSQECKEYRPLYHQIYLNEMPVSDQLQLLQVLCTHYASEAKGYCENPDEALVAMVAGIAYIYACSAYIYACSAYTHVRRTFNTHTTHTQQQPPPPPPSEQ
jgi:hypothetical protein